MIYKRKIPHSDEFASLKLRIVKVKPVGIVSWLPYCAQWQKTQQQTDKRTTTAHASSSSVWIQYQDFRNYNKWWP